MSSGSPVALIGPAREAHVAAMRDLLEKRGVPAVVLDTEKFPGEERLAWTPEGGTWNGVDLASFRSAYVRLLMSTPVIDASTDEAMKSNWYATLMAYREKGTALAGALDRLGCPVVNPPDSVEFTQKPVQLRAFRDAGIPIPRTLVTNDPDAVRRFAAEVPRLIYKPVTGGATVRPLSEGDLVPERLERLRNAPVMFQEFVGGENVRAYVVGGRVVAAAAIETTDDYDFRRAEGELRLFPLPAEVDGQCVRAAGACRLAFTAVDIKHDGDRWAFLEANPSPMWWGFDRKSGAGVGEALADHLARTP